MLYIALLTWHGSDLNTNVDGVDDAVGFKLAWMGVGNAIGCPVTAEPQFLQLLHTLSASRWCHTAFFWEKPKKLKIKPELLAKLKARDGIGGQ
ncbi:hypothetical protein PRIPAC_72109 [Pristionchus pacificus]|uniref:Uncharacterized protein n=1 Tax=Pristionchus pacificus TaxID=54126 RepID=A0A2A6C837_PRIPA|nr:hypothetical protein PRIPAC_72109 [Pristionchus pacificus]|eukprot:PDM74372.1 hypothetical protein PRIPAC_41728 [Pristionchus pacificus]